MTTHALCRFPLHFIVPLSYRSAYIGEHGARRVNGDESIVRSSVFDMLAPNRRSKLPIKRQLCPRNSKTPPDSTRFREQCEPNSKCRVRVHFITARRHIISSEASIRRYERSKREDWREITTRSGFVALSLRIYTLRTDCRSINPRENGPFRSILPTILCHRAHR